MTQHEDVSNTIEEQGESLPRHIGTSKKVTDHLANQRTFLAWIRTGLATITFGFVVERFGLLLRELGIKIGLTEVLPIHYSSFFGVSLTILACRIFDHFNDFGCPYRRFACSLPVSHGLRRFKWKS